MIPSRIEVATAIESIVRADRGTRPPIAIVACNGDADYWREQFEKTVVSMGTMAHRVVDTEAKLGGWQLFAIALCFTNAAAVAALILK